MANGGAASTGTRLSFQSIGYLRRVRLSEIEYAPNSPAIRPFYDRISWSGSSPARLPGLDKRKNLQGDVQSGIRLVSSSP